MVFPEFAFWLLLNLCHFSFFPFTCSNNESARKKPGFALPLERASVVFPLLRQSAEVVEHCRMSNAKREASGCQVSGKRNTNAET